MYDPIAYKNAYDKVEHGKARMAAMRRAIEEADANGDRPFQFFFREELCYESAFYDDYMDMLVVFPELLALADKYPDTPSTQFDKAYKNAVDHILWVYKWILYVCEDYYQIPMEDCLKFFEDFKRRSIAYGYSLRPYYRQQYYFYDGIDQEKADRAFYAFERAPRDGNSDCKACERNTTIKFYLGKGDLKRAEGLSGDIENRTLRCGADTDKAWVSLKGNYLSHYMDEGNLEESLKYCRLLERKKREMNDIDWNALICCYAHADLGKALKLYKEHWKKFQENRKPTSIFWIGLHISHFFQKLAESRKGSTVKLALDSSFPLYKEDGQYKISDLYEYYYQLARDVAEKLDARNGTDYFGDKLKAGIHM